MTLAAGDAPASGRPCAAPRSFYVLSFPALPISRKNVNAAFTGRLIGGWIASFVVTYDVRPTKKNFPGKSDAREL